MANKNKNSINENMEVYTEYFKEDLDALDEELDKSIGYSKIIDDEINKLTAPSLGMNKGGQHYLIEHITNAVQLQTQRQALRRDKVNIKKAILEYAQKFANEEADNSNASENYMNEVAKLIEQQKSIKKEVVDDSSLDEEIEKSLIEDEQ